VHPQHPELPDFVVNELYAFYLDSNLTVTRAVRLTGPEYEPRTEFKVLGPEDARANRIGSKILISATVRNMRQKDAIATCELDLATHRLHGFRFPEPPGEGREKNWMPIFGREEWVYHTSHDNHTTLATPAADNASWVLTQGPRAPAAAQAFRGGSQLVPLPGGSGYYIALVHETAHGEDGAHYHHRFVLFGPDFGIKAASTIFYFQQRAAVEYAAGIAISGGGESGGGDSDLVITFGMHDTEAWAARVKLGDVLALFGLPDATAAAAAAR
jgi:hypothetical protein